MMCGRRSRRPDGDRLNQTSISLALAAITFVLSVIWGMPFIRVLRHRRVVEARPSAPGIDSLTMGGLLFVLPVALLTILLNFTAASGLTGLGLSSLLPLGTLLAFTVFGSWLDWRRMRGKTRRGLPDWTGLAVQVVLAGLITYALHNLLEAPEMYLPFYEGEIQLGFWYLPIAVLLIVGAPGAFQVTSGVDGLAGLLAATAFASFGAIGLIQGQIFVARFCFTVVGALFGFLWFNIKPAVLHMGRTGTYAIGSTLAVISLMSGQWPVLALIASVPLLELLSILLQWVVGKISPGRTLFRLVPLHAHFEVAGWSTTQVVQRFWLINLLFAMIGITLSQV